MSGQTAEYGPGVTATKTPVLYVCAHCASPLRFDDATMTFFHETVPEYRQYGTIAREVKPA